MQRLAEKNHLWAEWYLIYTPFTPFECELPDEMRALCVMQGAFLQRFGRNSTKSRNES